VMDAAEARTRGDATPEQRVELQRLLETKRYSKQWRDQFFHDVRADGGLSTTRASTVIRWLNDQLDGPAKATVEQIERIEVLLSERIAPATWAQHIRDSITAGTLSFDHAELYLRDLVRLPKWVARRTKGGRR
jgi:hypothetical protein